MAKHVGKIFKVNNKDSNIKGNGSHFVEVKWFNSRFNKYWQKKQKVVYYEW